MARAPHLLFLHSGGSQGVGEYARCLILAEAARARWPGASIRFLADRRNPRFPSDRFERRELDGTPHANPQRVRSLLRELAADVVVFDNTARTAHLVGARAGGARTVFVSSRRDSLRRGARPWRLARLDQLWLVRPRFDRDESGPLRRLAARALGTERLQLDTLYPESLPERRAATRRRVGVAEEPYVLFAPGGGGWQRRGRPVAEIWRDAAERAAARTGLRAVAVMGPLYTGPARDAAGVVILPAVTPEELSDLLHDAEVAALGAGSLLVQALTQRRACVAAPAGGPDQAARLAVCAARRLVEPAEPEPDSLARGVERLLNDAASREALRARAAAEGLANGLPSAIDALARLL